MILLDPDQEFAPIDAKTAVDGDDKINPMYNDFDVNAVENTPERIAKLFGRVLKYI